MFWIRDNVCLVFYDGVKPLGGGGQHSQKFRVGLWLTTFVLSPLLWNVPIRSVALPYFIQVGQRVFSPLAYLNKIGRLQK